MKIPMASEMWQQQNNRYDFDRACESVLRAIERAQQEGAIPALIRVRVNSTML